MDTSSSVPPHIQPPMAQVPSATRELTRFVRGISMYSSMLPSLSAYLKLVFFWRLIKTESRSSFAVETQMRAFFHLKNYRREILLCSFVRLPRIDLKSSTRCRHLRPKSSRELENQAEILVH